MARAAGGMTDIPPPRYRVIERGRRLEVIDTLTGNAPISRVPVPVTRDARLRLSLPRQTRFDGSADLTTSRLYDDKAPRLVKLDSVAAAQLSRAKLAAIIALFVYVIALIWLPWLLAAPVLLLQNGARKPVRAAITRWLDRVADGTL